MQEVQNSTFSNWELLYFISTYVLAAAAIAGFIFSQRSAEKVSNALKVIQRGLSSLSEPLIKFSGYQWIVGKDGTTIISQSNPPQGILFSYANVSNIPVQILDSDFKVFYGDKEFDEPTTPLGSERGETFILAPNESIQSGTKQPEAFEKYLGNPKDLVIPPHFNLKLRVDFKTMDGEKFRYSIHIEMHFNIEAPGQKSSKTLSESIERCR